MSNSTRLATLVAGLLTFAAAPAEAGVLIQSSMVGGAPTGVAYATFNSLALGGTGGSVMASNGQSIQVNFLGDAQAVQGASGGVYAAPFLSNGNGGAFGTPDGADASTYLTSGSRTAFANSGVELVFSGAMTYLGLLWGSVDNYNSLDFYGADGLIGTITGSQVWNNANGDQGAQGTFYVNIVSDTAFTRVVARSDGYAFEFDNVAFNATNPVPEPLTLSLMGLGLLALGFAARRRRQHCHA